MQVIIIVLIFVLTKQQRDMKTTGYLKTVPSANERYYIKPIRLGCYGVYDSYDKSMSALCVSKEEAEKMKSELIAIKSK